MRVEAERCDGKLIDNADSVLLIHAAIKHKIIVIGKNGIVLLDRMEFNQLVLVGGGKKEREMGEEREKWKEETVMVHR